MKTSTLSRKILNGIVAAVFWICVWYALAFIVNKEMFLPFPHTVAIRFAKLIVTIEFWKITLTSLIRIMLGFLLGSGLGVIAAILTHKSKVFKTLFSPAVGAVRAIPVVSFILLAYLWLDNDSIPVVIALLMVMPVVWQNMVAGLSSLDRGLLEMAEVFSLSIPKKVSKVIFPQLVPYIYSGLFSALGLAWKSGVAAEVISYPRVAIGRAMNEAKFLLNTADVLVWTVVIVALCLVFEWLIKLLFNKGGRKL